MSVMALARQLVPVAFGAGRVAAGFGALLGALSAVAGLGAAGLAFAGFGAGLLRAAGLEAAAGFGAAGFGSAGLAAGGLGAVVAAALGAGVATALGALGATWAAGFGAGCAAGFGAVSVTAVFAGGTVFSAAAVASFLVASFQARLPLAGISGSVTASRSSANLRWLASRCSAKS